MPETTTKAEDVPVHLQILGLMTAITYLPGSAVAGSHWRSVILGGETGLIDHMLYSYDRLKNVQDSGRKYVILRAGSMALETVSIVMLTKEGEAVFAELVQKMMK